jgi:Superfamily I DNA and RNA helicases and helicase subunits
MIVPEKHAYWIDSSEISGQRVFEHRKEGSKSAANIVEAHAIIELLRKMEIQYSNLNAGKNAGPVSVGVISFYYDQVELLRKLFQDESFHAIDVEINTVDRFQGKEKAIILVSLVRNTPRIKHKVNSFIAAYQRINVAFSRAQNLLIIVGARNLYADQPVRIDAMNRSSSREVYVYREIIEKLHMKGALFSADDVIPEQTANKVLEFYNSNYGVQNR